MFNKICIIGVGLIGGSIASSSRKNGLCREIVGVGRSEKNLQLAVKLGVIDRYELSIKQAVKDADVVVLCTPVGSFKKILEELKENWSASCIYTDVGSTKESVLTALEDVFGDIPDNFVAAHPIAGSENNGVAAATDHLFENKRVIITPVKQTNTAKRQQCALWWEGMGASVSEMAVKHHDEVFAATSHLPHVLAYTLVELLKSKQNEQEIFEYAAGGFKDFTRIASSDPEMWADICVANGTQLVKIMKELERVNQKVSSLIEAKDKQGLLKVFESARQAREYFLNL